MSHKLLGQVLLQNELVSEPQLVFAMAYQEASGRGLKIGAVLIEQGFTNNMSIAQALAQQADWLYYVGAYVVNEAIMSDLGIAFCREHKVFPLQNNGLLAFVMPDGNNIEATDALLARYGSDICFYIGIELDILNAIEASDSLTWDGHSNSLIDLKYLLLKAVRLGATDIHIEPSLNTVNVRLRVDGVLIFLLALPIADLSRLVNICFNRAGISAGDYHHFHDARFEEECAGHKFDIRLSHIPSVIGSSLVLRLLDKSRSAVPLSELGYAAHHIEQLMMSLRRPHGLMLFTGPTGCGKTTSLYSLLSELKGLSIKVVTAEDPVEIRLPLVTQVSVDNRKDQDFHHITRALLRHDPDIILLGEIRDEKTAREAVRAAVTGHRVLATLHTNDVFSAILRMHDLGVDYPQLAHTLTCIVSQRLIRLLCPYCKQFSIEGHEYLPTGCNLCLGGFKNRTVVAETMYIDDKMRAIIDRGMLQDLTYNSSFERRTIREDGERLIQEGRISRHEMERVLG